MQNLLYNGAGAGCSVAKSFFLKQLAGLRDFSEKKFGGVNTFFLAIKYDLEGSIHFL